MATRDTVWPTDTAESQDELERQQLLRDIDGLMSTLANSQNGTHRQILLEHAAQRALQCAVLVPAVQ